MSSHSSSEAFSDPRASVMGSASELRCLRGDVQSARDDLLTALVLQEVREQYMQEVQRLLDAVHCEALQTRTEVLGARDEILWAIRAVCVGDAESPADVLRAPPGAGAATAAERDVGGDDVPPLGNDFPEFLGSLQNFPVWSRQAWPKDPSTASASPATCEVAVSSPLVGEAAGMGPAFASLEMEALKVRSAPKSDEDGGSGGGFSDAARAELPLRSVAEGDALEDTPALLLGDIWDEDMEEARRIRQQDLLLTDTIQHVFPDTPVVRGPLSVIRWFVELEEPERFGFLSFIVMHRYFDRLCMSVIFLNSIFAAYVVDWEVTHVGETPTLFIRITEFALMSFYLAELCLKISVHRHFFWCNSEWRFNCFDTFLVVVSLYDLLTVFQVLRGNVAPDSSGTNIMVMRLCRLLKLTKVVRLLRVLHFFRELRLMLVSIHRSFLSLFWVLVLLVFLLYVFSLILVQGVTIHLQQHGEDLPEQERRFISEELGSMSRAALSLYKVTTGGEDWSQYHRVAMECGPFYGLLFIFYIAFFTFAVMNILTGMIVENVVKQSEDDDDALMFQYRQQHRGAISDAQRIFEKLDADGDGLIGIDEFHAGIRSDVVRALMQSIDLEVKDAEWFFKVLLSISDTDSVDIGHFVSACLKMKGTATAVDLQFLSYEIHQIRSNLLAICKQMALPEVSTTNKLKPKTALESAGLS